MNARDNLNPARLESAIDRPSERIKVIWGAENIAAKIGCSADFVRDRLSKEAGSPVRKVCGRWCAVEVDLIRFVRVGPG
ncbi:hypothetical protein M2360_000741 [Rhizobium sp. SG_E_25_P2]|uniref:hypothetical protein n=1 Tax=Rhizobium sp. SG_E_25_P2 TaxID=2879942 RepID=UPI002474C0F0|nr:hypothetical protein [Rhizobium sp. SG_E_25_P2]MDH6265360.1 hypothetical protein [Rhizobium sp. SG_E_25_P2]